MTHTNNTSPATSHTPEPWDCDARITMYAAPELDSPIDMIEVRANVTDAGWDTVAFVEAIWPGAAANAHRIAAAVNACEGLTTAALKQGTIRRLLQAVPALLDAAADLEAAIDGATDQFNTERAELDTAWQNLHAAFVQATGVEATVTAEMAEREVLARRQQIAAIWSVEDVQEVRPDLTEKQAWEVLQQVDRQHDAMLGITWTTLEIVAEDLFGPADAA